MVGTAHRVEAPEFEVGEHVAFINEDSEPQEGVVVGGEHPNYKVVHKAEGNTSGIRSKRYCFTRHAYTLISIDQPTYIHTGDKPMAKQKTEEWFDDYVEELNKTVVNIRKIHNTKRSRAFGLCRKLANETYDSEEAQIRDMQEVGELADDIMALRRSTQVLHQEQRTSENSRNKLKGAEKKDT